jgi:hypothetical protein
VNPMRYLKTLENRAYPHVVMFFQWVFLTMLIGSNFNFSVFVTGAVTQGGFKVIVIYHLMVPLLSILLLPIFYKARKEGIAEKCITCLSVITSAIGLSSVYLYFVDDFVFLMKGTELAAWCLYNVMFSISMYTILTTLLTFIEQRLVRSKTGDDAESFLDQGQK